MTNIKATIDKSPSRPEKIFIGVSWPYASGNIHLGHLAGQYVVCDIFARYHRLKGNNVLMVSGSDSHGAPVIFAAEEQGTTPEELSSKSHELIKDTYRKLGFLYENYTSTHTKNHEIVSQNIFLVLEKLGYLTIKKSEQYYDPKAKRFLPDRYVRGTCPHCKATNARGDECPECGEMLDPTDLIDPFSTLSDSTPVLKETQHYYLDLAKTEPALKAWLKDKTHWRKWVKEFTDGWLRGGLRPRSVTRDLSFGVPVPIKGWEEKVLYVWIEAVVGYLSAAIEWAEKQGKPSDWESFWKDPLCKHYYFVAGGNVPFHTIIWPAELIGYNEKYADEKLWEQFKLPGESLRKPLDLPYDVPANNMLTYRGRKMSKGDKTGIGLDPLLETYGPDLLRYFFARFAPENDKRELTWKDFIDANNNELVANIGNFINRVLSFTFTRFEGKVPDGTLEETVKTAIQKGFTDIGSHIEHAEFVRSIESLLELGHFANKYFNDEKAWETIKTDPNKAAQTIYNSLQLVQAFRVLLKPFLPFSSDKLGNLLNVTDPYDPNKELETSGSVTKKENLWRFVELPAGHTINSPEVLFPKHEYSEELQKEDNPDTRTHVVPEDFPYNFSHLDEHIVVGKVTGKSDDKKRVVSVDIAGPSPLSVVCKDETLTIGQIVPVALPGTKIRSIHGEQVKIKAGNVRGVHSDAMLCGTYELEVGEEKQRILSLPELFGTLIGRPLCRIRTVFFKKNKDLDHIPTAWTVVEDVNVKKNRSKELDTWIHEQIMKIKKNNSGTEWSKQPLYREARALHSQYGADGIPGSAEDIVNFILEKGDAPTINNIVDLYNVFSALTGISIGAHDIEKLNGNPRLDILKEDTPFKHATTGENDIAKRGEYAYVDNTGILCRLDIKQAHRTMVTKDTKHILVLFQGNGAISQSDLERGVQEFAALMKRFI